MTPEEKIAELVEHIKKEFPKGCDKAVCKDCPLYKHAKAYGTTEFYVCEMLSNIESAQSP